MAENLDAQFKRIGFASTDATIHLSSTEDFDFLCGSCKTTGDHVEAVGYCIDCSESLCKSCVKYHFKNKILKQHVILHLHQIKEVSDLESGQSEHNIHSTEVETSSDVEVTKDLTDVTFHKNVNVKIKSDDNECIIEAIAILSDKSLAVIDSSNKALKVFDSKNDTVKYSMKLRGRPFSMTCTPQDQLVVSLGDEHMLNIISTQRGLDVVKVLRMESACYGVIYLNGKLLVSLDKPPMFVVIDFNGRVLEKIVPGSDVSSLCTIPRHIALSPDQKNIFVTYWENNVVLSIDMKGNKIAENLDFNYPAGVIFLPHLGCVLVCERDKHNIRRMSIDLKDSEIVLNPGDDVVFPRALLYCPEQEYLYVCSQSENAEKRNTVKIFRFRFDRKTTFV